MNPSANPGDGKHEKKEYHYSVDGKQYKTPDSAVTGAQVKAQIPDFNPSYQLVLEGRGGQPDRVITDNDSVDLNVHPELGSWIEVESKSTACRVVPVAIRTTKHS